MVSVDDIKKEKKKKYLFKKSCFKHILELVNNKILLISKTEARKTYYEIPLFVIGYPTYEINEAKDYIVGKLKKKGFEVLFLNPNILLINW